MNRGLTAPKLADPWPIQFWDYQLTDLKAIARGNDRNINNLGRVGADFIIRATELNGGVLPHPSQIFIRRMLAKRARRDAGRRK